MARIKNSIKNTAVSIGMQILKLAIMFAVRTIFIYTIGITYLGLDSIFSNILTLLSLSEMGIGSAIMFSMYKPIADNDYEKTASILAFYKKVYMLIGLTILVLGCCFLPFLDKIISSPENIDVNIYLVYALFLLNIVAGYFFAYKRAIIVANQKSFIESANRTGFILILSIVQILVLVITKNYIIYLISVIICTVLENISISIIANKMFPYIVGKAIKLDTLTKKTIYKNTFAMFLSKISSTVVSGTDSIILSIYFGITLVGQYSNYVFIIAAIATFLGFFVTSFSASIGNLIATEVGRSYDVFKKLRFAFMLANGFAAVCLFVLLNAFIPIWAGAENVLSIWIVLALVFNSFISNERSFIRAFKQGSGYFWNDKYVFLAEAILNIVVSLVLVNFIGILGIVLGTGISSCITGFISEPYVTYKHCFKKPLKNYFLSFIYYFAIIVLIGFLVWFICGLLPSKNIGYFVLKLVVCVLTTALLFIVAFFKNSSFSYYFSFLKDIVFRKKRAKSFIQDDCVANENTIIEKDVDNENEE